MSLAPILPVDRRRSYLDAMAYDDDLRAILHDVFPHLFIREATPEEDMREAADYVGLGQNDGIAVAARMRFRTDYRHVFGFREARASGAKTEFAKVLEGNGTHALTAWTPGRGEPLEYWAIVDLERFREQWRSIVANSRAVHDATFREYDLRDLNARGIVYAANHDLIGAFQPPPRRRPTQKDVVADWLRRWYYINEELYRTRLGFGKHLSAYILLLVREGWDIRTAFDDGHNGYTLLAEPGRPPTMPTLFGPDECKKRVQET